MSMQYCVNKYFSDDKKCLEEDLLEFLKCSINKPFVEEKELHLKMHTMFDTSAGALVATTLIRMNFSPDMMIINEFYEISQFHGNFTTIFIKFSIWFPSIANFNITDHDLSLEMYIFACRVLICNLYYSEIWLFNYHDPLKQCPECPPYIKPATCPACILQARF